MTIMAMMNDKTLISREGIPVSGGWERRGGPNLLLCFLND